MAISLSFQNQLACFFMLTHKVGILSIRDAYFYILSDVLALYTIRVATFQCVDGPSRSLNDGPAYFSILLRVWAPGHLQLLMQYGSISGLYMLNPQSPDCYIAIYSRDNNRHEHTLNMS